MEQVNAVMGHITGFTKNLVELLLTMLSLGAIGQLLFSAPIFGMDVIGNVVSVIETLGNAGMVGLLSVMALFAIISKK